MNRDDVVFSDQYIRNLRHRLQIAELQLEQTPTMNYGETEFKIFGNVFNNPHEFLNGEQK